MKLEINRRMGIVLKQQYIRFTSGTFTQAEVKNTFELFDLKREGVIKKEKCR